MDSKSKLESKNPNKIQTAKIQSPKASKDLVNLESQRVVESNPKDLAKLESNSPKLKDSKVSKTSKDSMKLESSPKLDSKSLQKSNKESESKQPKKIQRAKTCDSKKPTKSQKSKLKSFIRTIPISIALASALSSQAVADWQNIALGNIVDSNGTIANNVNMGGGRVIYLDNDQGSLDLTIMGNITSSSSATGSDNGSIEIRNKSIAGTITNNGIFTASGSERKVIHVYGGSTLKAFVNNGVVRQQSTRSMIYLKGGSTIQNIINNGTMIQSGGSAGWAAVIQMDNDRTNVVNNVVFANGSTTSNTQSGAKNIINVSGNKGTIGNITANGNAKLNGNFAFAAGTITNGITFNGTSAMTGNISSSGRIGSIVLNNSSTIGGNISLTGGASIVNGISLLDSANMTGAITLAGSSAIANGITIGGNSTGGSGNNATLDGNITMDGTSAIANGITITNGGTYAGTIHTKNQSDIDSITIASGGVVGSNTANSMILSSGNSTIHNIDIQNGGTMYGNIEAHHITGASAVDKKDGNIGDVSIAGRLQGDIVLQNKVFMNSLTMSDNGTITGNIRIGESGNDDQYPTLGTIRLEGHSGINAITLGGAAAHATIDSLTLEGTSSIGTITNNSNGTISNIALNGTSTITNGITNNGNIGEITSNLDN
ncbi:hypothetical protein, partial [Helicobacter pullorum]